MVPDASEITRRRITAATVIRLGALAVAHIALIPICVLIVQILDGYINHSFSDWAPFLIPVCVIWGVALAVWCLAPWIARVMVRVPRVPVRPNCRFKLEGLMAPTCLECGYTLTPEFLTTPSERRQNIREPDTILLRQITTLVLRIGGGVAAPIAAILSFVFALEAIEQPQWTTWTPAFAWAGVSVFAVGFVLLSSMLSKLIVPGRRRFGGEELARVERTDDDASA